MDDNKWMWRLNRDGEAYEQASKQAYARLATRVQSAVGPQSIRLESPVAMNRGPVLERYVPRTYTMTAQWTRHDSQQDGVEAEDTHEF